MVIEQDEFINHYHYDFIVYYIIIKVLPEDDPFGKATPCDMYIIILNCVLLIFVHTMYCE